MGLSTQLLDDEREDARQIRHDLLGLETKHPVASALEIPIAPF
jgi:hypothetical protein